MGKLPSIFKLSVLINILPYYGYFHEWKSLLVQINTTTNDIWKDNKNTFKHQGKEYKKEIQLAIVEDEIEIPKNAELLKLITPPVDTKIFSHS